MLMRNCRTVALASFLALGSGCADLASVPAGTPAQQVQSKLGAPAMVWKNPDGSELWEYPQGPMGFQTFMVTMGSDRAVREVHQVMSDEYFSKVREGMSRDDVRRILGKPRDVMIFSPRNEEAWTWRYQDLRPMLFNVFFDRTTGAVRTTLRLEEILHMGPDD
jgi:hypothetical protein